LQKFCKQLRANCDSISYSVLPDAEDDNDNAKFGFYGDVKYVIAGNAPADLLRKAIDARTFRYAFEAATVAPVGDDNGYGEMVAFNGVCYVRSTRLGTDEYYKTLSGTHMRCPAVGMVSPANAIPHAKAVTLHGGMTFTSAMNDVFATVKKGCDAPAVAFGGIVEFHKLVATAIARSTNEGKNIFEHKEKYYPFPPSILFDRRCVVFGMVGDMDDAEKKGVKNLDKVLYKGASGAAGAGAAADLTMHAHLAVLHPACTARTAQDVQPEDVVDCCHLDVSSIVGSFELELWAIERSLEEHPTEVPMAIGQGLGAPVSSVRCNCSEWICNALADAGVTHVFGGHGGALAPLVNAVVRHPRLEWVVTRNEANASLMAAAYGKLTGKLGCCIATSGPGATNLTTGLFDAMLDQIAMIAITGLKPRAGIGYSEFQDFPQSRMFAAGGLPISADVASPEALPPMLRDAVAKALTMRSCAHLGVPVDVQEAECPVPVRKFCAAAARSNIAFPETQQFVLDNVATEIKLAAKRGHGRVLIAVGHRCVEAGAHILKLAERIHAPIFTRLDAKGCCDESHPLVLGVSGVHGKPGLENAALLIESSNLVLSFGNHDDTIVLCNKAGLQIRPMIQFEPDAACVLANARFQALHTVVGHIAWAIDKLLERLDAIEPESSVGAVEEWKLELDQSGVDTEAPTDTLVRSVTLPRIERRPSRTTSSEVLWEKMREGYWNKLKDDNDWAKFGRYEVEHKGDFKHCHPAAVLKEMSQHLSPNDVLSVDTGDVTLWAGLCAVLRQGQRTLSSERMGTMGYGLCAGIVASLIRGDTGRSVVVAGDGGIQMTINELGTARQLFAKSQTKHKLLVIVFDNERLGRVFFGFDGAMGCELGPSPDFVGIAKACGGDGATLSSPHELKRTMELAFASEGLFLLHVLVDPSVKADMATFKDKSTNMMNSG